MPYLEPVPVYGTVVWPNSSWTAIAKSKFFAYIAGPVPWIDVHIVDEDATEVLRCYAGQVLTLDAQRDYEIRPARHASDTLLSAIAGAVSTTNSCEYLLHSGNTRAPIVELAWSLAVANGDANTKVLDMQIAGLRRVTLTCVASAYTLTGGTGIDLTVRVGQSRVSGLTEQYPAFPADITATSQDRWAIAGECINRDGTAITSIVVLPGLWDHLTLYVDDLANTAGAATLKIGVRGMLDVVPPTRPPTAHQA